MLIIGGTVCGAGESWGGTQSLNWKPSWPPTFPCGASIFLFDAGVGTDSGGVVGAQVVVLENS